MIFVVSMCLKFANARPFHEGSTQSFIGLWSYNKRKRRSNKFLLNNILYVGSLMSCRRAVSVNANMGQSVCRVASLPEVRLRELLACRYAKIPLAAGGTIYLC